MVFCTEYLNSHCVRGISSYVGMALRNSTVSAYFMLSTTVCSAGGLGELQSGVTQGQGEIEPPGLYLQPGLDGAVARAVARELDVLALARVHANRDLGRLAGIVLAERQVVHVVEALGQVAQDELRVGALGEDVQQVGGGHEVEAREGDALGLQVVLAGGRAGEGL